MRGFHGSSLEVVFTTSAHIPLAGTQLERGGLRNMPKKKKLFFSFSFFCFVSVVCCCCFKARGLRAELPMEKKIR